MPRTEGLASTSGGKSRRRVALGGRLSSWRRNSAFEFPIHASGAPQGQKTVSHRHAIAVHLLDAGADVAFVQDWLGHANMQNTIIYMRYTTAPRDAHTRHVFASH